MTIAGGTIVQSPLVKWEKLPGHFHRIASEIVQTCDLLEQARAAALGSWAPWRIAWGGLALSKNYRIVYIFWGAGWDADSSTAPNILRWYLYSCWWSHCGVQRGDGHFSTFQYLNVLRAVWQYNAVYKTVLQRWRIPLHRCFRCSLPEHSMSPKDVMLQVDADNVVIDNSWLWRADHIQTGQLVQGQNPCQDWDILNWFSAHL